MITNTLAKWELSEGRDGLSEWVEKTEKINPYSRAGKIHRKPISGPPDKKGHRWGVEYNQLKRAAPNEKGYTWSMGYSQCVGRYTQGSLFPELSGSSLNRKKNEKVIPRTAADIIALADKTVLQYRRRGVWLVQGFGQGIGTKISVGDVLAWIYNEIGAENLISAGELAVWFSQSLRALPGAISYGVHVLSTRSRGKIKDKATAFFRSCPGDRIFGTFSFIAPVDDKTGQSILNKFLVQCRKKFPGLQYFWVAERQDNGNIHFHMILNKRLPVGRWNALWVLQQYNAGLVGHDEWGDEISKERIMELYALDQKEGYCGARSKDGKKKISRIQAALNPLDLKKVKSIGRLSSYLTKYITKQEKNKPFGCAVWHCSRRVSRMFTRQTVGPSAFAYMKSMSNWGVDKKTGEIWGLPQEFMPCPYAVVIYALDKTAPLRYLRRMEQVNKWVLEGVDIPRVPMVDDQLYQSYFKPQPC
jgi:hypothetical protein